jgi:hypothetical protein
VLRRSLPLLALSALLSMALVQPAAAIFEETENGNTGTWSAKDDAVTPGGRCDYNDKFRLRRISARPPVAFAHRAGGQYVKWRLRVDKSYKVSDPNNYADTTVYTSPWQKKFATKSKAAAFTPKAWLREGSLADSTIRFKVWVIAKWLRPNGKSEGTVSYRYSWFRQVGPSGLDSIAEDFYCYRAPY